jgi:hypothetical protein
VTSTIAPGGLDERVFAVMWALVTGLLVYPALLALAWANKYRWRWHVTSLFIMYIFAMIVLLINLKR